MGRTEITGKQVKDETILSADIGAGAVRGSSANGGSQREVEQGTISDSDLRIDSVTASKIDSTDNYQMGTLSLGASIVTDTILALTSTTKAFLLPRMTTTQMNNIGTPLGGMQIFDTTTSQFMGYNGTSWIIVG